MGGHPGQHRRQPRRQGAVATAEHGCPEAVGPRGIRVRVGCGGEDAAPTRSPAVAVLGLCVAGRGTRVAARRARCRRGLEDQRRQGAHETHREHGEHAERGDRSSRGARSAPVGFGGHFGLSPSLGGIGDVVMTSLSANAVMLHALDSGRQPFIGRLSTRLPDRTFPTSQDLPTERHAPMIDKVSHTHQEEGLK